MDVVALGQVLFRLEWDGYISSVLEPDSGHPPLKKYTISDKGCANLSHRVREWNSYGETVGRVLGDEAAPPA